MKIFKQIGIATSLLTIALLTSCSDKGYWDEAPLEHGYSFNSANFSKNLNPGPQEVKVTLHRSVTTAAESVEVSFTPGKGCPGDITVESPVTFEAGATTADVILHIANANPPYTYSGILTFNGDASYAGISKCTLKMPVEYLWEPMGTGKFCDAFVMDDVISDVEILKAQGFNRYRVMNPYKDFYENGGAAAYGDMYGSNGSEYIEFWETSDGLLTFSPWNTGLIYQGKKEQTIVTAVGVKGFDIWDEPGHAYLSPVYNISQANLTYGQQKYAVQIILPN